MTAVNALKYYKAIDTIEAREVVLEMQLLDYQRNMNSKDRAKFQREVNKAAYPNQQKTASPEDFVRMFQGVKNGK